jgi:predicted Ser/Thr protein kinase
MTADQFDGDETRQRDRPGARDQTAARDVTGARDQTAARDRSRELDQTAYRLPSTDETLLRNAEPTLFRGRSVPRAEEQSLPFGPGHRLRGRYLLEELIGQGAMGQVWRAKDLLGEEAKDRNPYVAVKVLNSDFEGRADAFISLHREATRAQKLAHPNIVTVYVFDRDEESGRAFIAMELLEGQPLDRLIRKSGGLSREEFLPILRGMAEGLAHAHRKGIVHSDFKPANVFVTSDGTPKILDFGIARAVQLAERAGVPHVAQVDDDGSGFQGYTVNYAAPEALAGAAPNTTEDVFSLGIVAYELASGSHPFQRKSALEAREEGIPRVPLRSLKRRECNVIEKALAYEPAQRYPDAAALLRDLQGTPVIQVALVAAVGVLLITAGGLWYRHYRDSQPKEPLEQLPALVRQQFAEQVGQGNVALDFVEKTHDIHGSADAAEYFARAYSLHEKDPQAVRGLEKAADYAIDWYLKSSDRRQARAQLELFSQKSDFYQSYGPLQKAIRSLSDQ